MKRLCKKNYPERYASRTRIPVNRIPSFSYVWIKGKYYEFVIVDGYKKIHTEYTILYMVEDNIINEHFYTLHEERKIKIENLLQ